MGRIYPINQQWQSSQGEEGVVASIEKTGVMPHSQVSQKLREEKVYSFKNNYTEQSK